MSLKATVIVCTLNRAENLKSALISLIGQSFPRDLFEIVVVDNGSTDHTRRVVEEYRKLYPGRLVYIYEASRGLSVARNRGVKEAKGDILAFMDGRRPRGFFLAVLPHQDP